MRCNVCGQEIVGNGNVCNYCGAVIPVEAATPENAVYQNVTPENVMPVAVDPGAGKGQVALILGIVSLALGVICSCAFACLGGILPLGVAIVGIVLGAMAMKESKDAGFVNKKAKIGMILSIVAVAIIFVFILLNAIAGGVIGALGAIAETNYHF